MIVMEVGIVKDGLFFFFGLDIVYAYDHDYHTEAESSHSAIAASHRGIRAHPR